MGKDSQSDAENGQPVVRRTLFTSARMSTVAAAASAIAAVAALGVTWLQADLPFETALYQARWQSSADFSFAMSQFYYRYDRVRVDMPDWVNDPTAYSAKSDEDFMDAARAAQPILEAFGDLSAQVSKAGTPWTKATILKTSETLDEAERLSACFRKLATFTSRGAAPPTWWDDLRQSLPSDCAGSLNIMNAERLKELAQSASQAMAAETLERAQLDDLESLPKV